MSDDLPDPLTPPECNLRDFPYMPVDVRRLLASETWLIASAEEKVAAITLWLESWHQVPAASLPDDDRALAALSRAGSRWPKLKAVALRGWTRCRDGRWYHPVVAEKAMEAWNRRRSYQDFVERQRAKGIKGAEQRWRRAGKEGNPDGTGHDPVNGHGHGHGHSSGHGSGHGNGHDTCHSQWQWQWPWPNDGLKGEGEGKKRSAIEGITSARARVGGDQDPAETPSPSPEVRIIQAFDRARVRVYGESQARPFPAQTDHSVARRLLDAGADAELVGTVCELVMRRRQERGKEPPRNLAYIEGAVMDTLADAKRPPVAASPSHGKVFCP